VGAFYTYHKIMAGLLDMHVLTGNADALEVCEGMAKWRDRISGDRVISAEQRQRRLRTEYGGMNEVLVNLAAVTKKTATSTPHASSSSPASRSACRAPRRVAGSSCLHHVPKIIGAAP